jgi:hypothetical protein
MLGPILFIACLASALISFGAWLRGLQSGRETLLNITFGAGGMLLCGRLGAFGAISPRLSDALFYAGGALMMGAAVAILRSRRTARQRING